MLGAVLGAAGSLASGLFGKKAADNNVKMQKEFAQKGIQWKVADAKAAKIHPLAALGAQTHSFSPVAAGDFSGLAQAGQDLGRALQPGTTETQRVAAYTRETQKLALERASLENDVLRADLASKLAKTRIAGTPPAVADPNNPNLIPGQGNSPGIEDKAMERQGWRAETPSVEAGAVTDVGGLQTGTGIAPVMSKDAKERLEDDTPGMIGWNLRNRLLQSFQMNMRPPMKAPIGTYWVYHPLYQEYQLRKKRTIYDATRDHPARTGKPYR